MNTVKKKEVQSRSWILTLPQSEYSQLEEGAKSGYKHWQVYIENDGPIKFSTLRNKFPKGHYEVRRGSRADAYNYCTKADTAQGVRIENGKIDLTADAGERTDLQELRYLVLIEGQSPADILISNPGANRYYKYLQQLYFEFQSKKFSRSLRDVKVHYLWGPAGSGKTSGLWNHYQGDFYRVSDYQHPWDAFNGESVLVLDEYRYQLHFSFLLDVLDRFPLQLPARYNNRWASWNEVWIVSNISLDDQYPRVPKDSASRLALERRINSVQELHANEEINYE
jgi:hypothetical protein